MTFNFDLNRVELNDRAKYLGQGSFRSKIVVRADRQTHIQSTDCSTWPLKWSVTVKGVDRHHVSQVLPVEIDLVDVRFQRQIERERVVVDDAVLDVIQLTWDT